MGRKAVKQPLQSLDVWQEVKTDIENKILSGYYAAGERIPSTRKLADDYNISLTTAQKVLRDLSREGVIEAKRSVGYFVNAYIRERIIEDRRRELHKRVQETFEEANLIGVDLQSLVNRLYSAKKS